MTESEDVMKAKVQATKATALSGAIAPMLNGNESGVVGAVLGDLVSIWLAGHRKEDREAILQSFIEYTRDMVSASVEQAFGDNPPEGWEA